ncbi:MAG: BamA/TamA family outer membrane protein [Saprospiraceae bacterium]|nr:BamA/TamA family outer membrane protein [Saprospiraceae bacterium]
MKRFWFIFLSISVIVASADGQEVFVHIGRIDIEGNEKTRDKIILRELPFSPGDSLPIDRLESLMREGEEMLVNTKLFGQVDIRVADWEASGNEIAVKVRVEEFWYLYPFPIFELADRNFNVWWVEQNRSLSRTNFGLEFTHLNTTGQRDRLYLTAKFGYTQTYALEYQLPFVNKAQTLGLITHIRYSRNKEINYLTLQNKQSFYEEDDRFVYSRFRSEFGLVWRPGLRTEHLLRIGYRQNQIAQVVADELNPDFFLRGRSSQRFMSLTYHYSYDKRNLRAYPTAGHYLRLEVEKDGLGLFRDRNSLVFRGHYRHFVPIGSRWSVALRTAAKISLLRNQQPYNDYRAIGFNGNNLHGFEYYVIDGLDMAYLKTSMRFRLLQNQIHFGKFIPLPSFRRMPVKIYAALHSDVGYVNDPFERGGNFLHNTPIWGGGIGMDFVFFHDKVFRLEYNFNHLMERGVFLHFNLNI